MRSAVDFAKYFIQNGNDSNTFDGNMRLQKLLTFANIVCIAKYGVPLFHEQMQAFKHGCVVEPVRVRYFNDHAAFVRQSKAYDPDFTPAEYDVLHVTQKLFDKMTARELSELQHNFLFWKNANVRQNQTITIEDIEPELDRFRAAIDAVDMQDLQCDRSEVVNGVTFYVDADFKFTDEVMQWLEEFSCLADEKYYTLYVENGKLVVY
jgi:uncharacterized phage-associated protein